jgi:membrane protein insertase Oxa1/YidC/SpoIIIJ
MFNSIIITPLYNILILLVDFLTTDIGIAVVIMTVIIRLLLFPLSKNQIQTQIKFNITSKSIILAFLAGLTQWIQLRMLNSVNKDNKEVSEKKDNPMGDMMKNFQTQMTYIMPLMIAFISYSFGVIIAIYLLTGNLFSIAQEYYLRKNIRKPELNTNIQAPKS